MIPRKTRCRCAFECDSIIGKEDDYIAIHNASDVDCYALLSHVMGWTEAQADVERRFERMERRLDELVAPTISRRGLMAWLVDRAEQFGEEDVRRAAIEDLVGRVRRDEPEEALAAGELDDILKRLR